MTFFLLQDYLWLKNHKQFEHIFEVNLDLQTFNPNLKTEVVYLVDGEINIDGYLQL